MQVCILRNFFNNLDIRIFIHIFYLIVFVLNYGWMYSGIWQILKRILPEESLNRIFFPSEQELWNYFDEENVLTGTLLLYPHLERLFHLIKI